MIKGLSDDLQRVDAQAEGFSKTCENNEEVTEILEKLKEAKVESSEVEPSITIVGQGSHMEIRREGPDLFLYDKLNLNIQGLKITPNSAFKSMDGDTQTGAEESEESGGISSSGLDRKALGILLGIGVVVTLVVQAILFVSQNPDPIQPVRLTNVTNAEEIEELKNATVGTYYESTGNLNFGIQIMEDGTYAFLDITQPEEGTSQSTPFEKGTYQFGKREGTPVILFQDQSLAEVSADGLEFYGYSLSKVNLEDSP